jgi:hypothetical protein
MWRKEGGTKLFKRHLKSRKSLFSQTAAACLLINMAALQAAYSNMGAEMLSAAKDYVTQGDDQRWSNLADGLVCLHVSHSNLTRRMIEIRFDKHMRIDDLKAKLHTHTGTPAFSQKLVLRDGGHPVANMDDDSKVRC